MTRVAPMLAMVLALGLARDLDAAPCGSDNLLAGKKPHLSFQTKGDLTLLTDGQVAPEGALWDAPVVVTLTTPSSTVTYDLGEPREISSLLMQGDANDVYRVAGSLDDSPGSYAPLAAFDNVLNIGHGLRTRTVELGPKTIRYLRVGEATGDGFFTISEVAAYCQKPSGVGKGLRVVEVPPQFAGEADQGDTKAFQTLYVLAALALAALGYQTFISSRKGSRRG